MQFAFTRKQTIMFAAVAMILRVWAMYSRSRLILGVLLALFSLQIIATLLAVSIYSNPRNELGV